MARQSLKRRLGSMRAWLARLRMAAASGLPDDWESTELAVRQKMEAPLRAHCLLVSDLDDLAFELLGKVSKPLVQPEAVVRAHFSLLSRVLQDLRACLLLARSGYTMQAWTVASSAFEAAHTMGFIAADPKRAESWLDHDDSKRPFCAVKTGVQGSFKYVELGKRGRDRDSLVDKEYSLYERLCMAKHVNPQAERNRYIGRRNGKTTLMITPFFTKGRAREARMGLLLVCRAATLALWVFQKAHLPDNNEDHQRVIELATISAKLLEDWKDLDPAAT